MQRTHDEQVARIRADAAERNAEVDELQAQYRAGDEEGVTAYNEMVLERSEYPDADFPQMFRVAYVAASRELVVEYDLPLPSIVPEETEFKYVRTRDAIEHKVRKPAEIKAIYQHIVASITLRTLHELFEAAKRTFSRPSSSQALWTPKIWPQAIRFVYLSYPFGRPRRSSRRSA